MMSSVKDVTKRVQSIEVGIAIFGATKGGLARYRRLVHALGDAILAETGLKRGTTPSPGTVLGPKAEKKFSALTVYVSKYGL